MAQLWPEQPLPNALAASLHILICEWERRKSTFWSSRFSSLCLPLRCSEASVTEQESPGPTNLSLFLWYLPLGAFIQCIWKHFVGRLLLQANIEKTIEEASMERIWSAPETALVLWQESHQQEKRNPLSYPLFPLLSIVRIVGTLFKWK